MSNYHYIFIYLDGHIVHFRAANNDAVDDDVDAGIDDESYFDENVLLMMAFDIVRKLLNDSKQHVDEFVLVDEKSKLGSTCRYIDVYIFHRLVLKQHLL